jgi:GT2 family glycosyltransferase
VLREDDPGNFVFPFPVLDRDGFPIIFSRTRKLRSLAALRARAPDGTYPFAHFFNGCLISAEAIRNTGNIETEYFIAGDEVDYFMRLRRAGAVISDLSAHHYHPDVTRRPLNEMKVYYYVKNSFILHRRYFNHPTLRNALAVAAVIARTATRNGAGTALSFLVGKHGGVLRKAIVRGLRGQLGNDLQV